MCNTNGNSIFTTPLCGRYTAFERHSNNKQDEVTVSVCKAHEKARIRTETPSVQEPSKEHRSTNFIKSCS